MIVARHFAVAALLVALLQIAACAGQGVAEKPRPVTVDRHVHGVHLASLAALSVETLRGRTYGSRLDIEAHFDLIGRDTYLAAFTSDRLREYARIDIPVTPMPADGFPIVVFLHGWVGINAAPALDFYATPGSDYDSIIKAFAAAGFVVITPGFRGHGTVNGISADGIEYLSVWDNGSYVMPAFYAIDVLNLLDGLASLESVDWSHWSRPAAGPLRLNLHRVNVLGHSQGGDVALIVLAVASAGSHVHTPVAAGSIWSGCFPARLTQLMTYGPIETTPEAFLAGDGTWNGTATGANGAVNHNFVLGYPPDWIESPDPQYWTWQRKSWSTRSVADALHRKLGEMYGTLNSNVDDIHNATYQLKTRPGVKLQITHDPQVVRALEYVGAFDRERFLTMPLSLHHSDRDFYSLPQWNSDLCARITLAGGACNDFIYPGTTHTLRLSKHEWFSGGAKREGFALAIRRDIELFRGESPRLSEDR